jgi:hypothetical protein
MEHLNVPDASLQFCLNALTEIQFEKLLDQFFAFIAARDRDVIGREAVAAKGRTQISAKMSDRLAAFAATPVHAKVDGMLAHKGSGGGLAELERRASALIEQAMSSSDIDHLAFSHGDPCLSNILFDNRIGLFRLVDPRGASARDDALLHPLYDIAKFAHSVCGGYDFVNNDLFSIEIGDDLTPQLLRHRNGAPDWVQRNFQQRLVDEGWDFAHVRAVEASLFLSMLPLHVDHPRKLLGFALIAADIIAELEAAQ